MNKRIERLTELTLKGEMYVKPVKTEFDRKNENKTKSEQGKLIGLAQALKNAVLTKDLDHALGELGSDLKILDGEERSLLTRRDDVCRRVFTKSGQGREGQANSAVLRQEHKGMRFLNVNRKEADTSCVALVDQLKGRDRADLLGRCLFLLISSLNIPN